MDTAAANDSQSMMDWFVAVRSPHDILEKHGSFLACELVFFTMAGLTLIHALRHGGRLKYLWLSTILHGLTVESVSYFVPDIDNFWHAQSMMMFLGRRLPLHIILFYPAFLYTASVSVSKLRLRWWAEPFAVGLAVVLLDVPFDIMGIKLLWWTWHDTDPNIYDRHYWVPWTSYYFHATFAAGFTIVFHGSHFLFTKAGRFQSAGCVKELVCSVLTGVLSMPMGVLEFLPLYHPLHDTYHIHSEVCVLLILFMYAAVVWAADRNPADLARSSKGWFNLDELSLIIIIHYTFYVLLVVFAKPERVMSLGVHEPVGPCSETTPVYTAFGHVLSKKKYLCLDGYDEGYFDFNCVKDKPHAGMNWYTVCGNPYPNHVEYICVVTAFCIGGFFFYWQALSRSSTLPQTNAVKKFKAD
ncbi:uncharacterized protein LOC135468849 [Liolophura sinensis]|uniref:uncharacterized protein LOC135468849 n=1 Tax=Liolophura sinensis TaxID=3198878 RepID=UPI0031583389